VASKAVRDYVWGLGPPSFIHGKYVDFFEEFINRYLEEAKRMYGYSGASTAFNKEEVGKNVKKLYEDILDSLKKEGSEGEMRVTVHRVEEKEGEDPHDYRLNESPTLAAAERPHEGFQRQEGGEQEQGEERYRVELELVEEEEKVNDEVFIYQQPMIRTYEMDSNIPDL
jgi:hypothetical protein